MHPMQQWLRDRNIGLTQAKHSSHNESRCLFFSSSILEILLACFSSFQSVAFAAMHRQRSVSDMHSMLLLLIDHNIVAFDY